MDLFRALKLKYNPVNWAVAEHDYTRKQGEYLSAFASSYIKPESVSMSDITAAYAILALSNLQHQQREPVYLSMPSSRSSSPALSPSSSVSSMSSPAPSSPALSDTSSCLDLSFSGAKKSKSCPDCGKKFASSSNLSRHRQIHANTGKCCTECGKFYTSMPALAMRADSSKRPVFNAGSTKGAAPEATP